MEQYTRGKKRENGYDCGPIRSSSEVISMHSLPREGKRGLNHTTSLRVKLVHVSLINRGRGGSSSMEGGREAGRGRGCGSRKTLDRYLEGKKIAAPYTGEKKGKSTWPTDSWFRGVHSAALLSYPSQGGKGHGQSRMQGKKSPELLQQGNHGGFGGKETAPVGRSLTAEGEGEHYARKILWQEIFVPGGKSPAKRGKGGGAS